MTVRVALLPSMFRERAQTLVTTNGFECTAFRFDSGVEALRVSNIRGEIVVLPFRGQQIWRAAFDDRDMTMRSMFEEPSRSTDYLQSYGAFFIHCGLTGIGAPGPRDSHPLHGELPSAIFDNVTLELNESRGTLHIEGSYRHTVAFSCNYLATSRIGLRRDLAFLDVSLSVHNLKRSPMDLMYLGHANFRPVNGARLVYSAPYFPEQVRVRQSVPTHIVPPPSYAALLSELALRPEMHHTLHADQAFDPEVVFSIDMQADAQGWAHALQVHPDGRADYVSHRPDQTPVTVRWLCRTVDQDALGLSLPATAGVEGYHAEKSAGRGVKLTGGGTWRADMRFGALTAVEAAEKERYIERCMGRS